jgi:hypothetical protein
MMEILLVAERLAKRLNRDFLRGWVDQSSSFPDAQLRIGE